MRSYVLGIALLANVIAASGCASETNQIVLPTYKTVYAQRPAEKEKSLAALSKAYPALTPDQIEAIYSTPRGAFVTDAARHRIYDDLALPIGSGQMTLKLSDIAFLMAHVAMRPTSKILEIGTGTGYFAVIMSRLTARVYTVEWIEYLSELAHQWLDRLQISNVEVRTGDGIEGWARHAPYDAIIVTAGLRAIPSAYFDQLKPGGHLAVPIIKDANLTQWYVYQKEDDCLVEIASQRTPVSAMFVGEEEIPVIDADRICTSPD